MLEARLVEEPATLLYREKSNSNSGSGGGGGGGGGGDNDGSGNDDLVVLMSDETFEQFSLPSSMLGAAAPFLADGSRVVLLRAPAELGGDALSARAEAATAEVCVLRTPPPRQGVHSSYQRVEVGNAAVGEEAAATLGGGGSGSSSSSSSSSKKNKGGGGGGGGGNAVRAEVAVPAHVSCGDRIVVDLRDGTFVRRV